MHASLVILLGVNKSLQEMAQENDEVDESLFLDVLPDYLKCPICLCCLQSPFQTPCGHRFCKDCITPVLNTRNNVCPKDRTVIDNTNTFPDNAVKLQINALRIRCPKHEAGCAWIGELSDKRAHCQSCDFVEVPCGLCGVTLQKKFIEAHKALCPKRQLPCEHCHTQFCFSDLSSHYAVCQEYPVFCRHECAVGKVPRKDEESHYVNDCPKQPVPCEMAPFGCTEQVERGAMGEHLIKCAPQRTLNLANCVLKLQKDVKELSLMLAQQKEQQEAMADTLYPCAGQFTWRLENIHQKVKQAQAGNPLDSVMYSPPFFSGEAGYKLCLCVYPAGDNNQDYLSVYFVIMRGPYDEILQWPFQKRIYLSLLSCKGGPGVFKDIQPDPRLHYFHRPEKPQNVGYGYPKFISLEKLLADDSKYLDSSCIFLRCKIYD